jgi:hypothetical protein
MNEEHWLSTHWRPLAAITYMIICLSDFVFFPMLAFIWAAYAHVDYIQWKPLTLDGAGTIHVAFGAILGVAAWTRGQVLLEAQKNKKDA